MKPSVAIFWNIHHEADARIRRACDLSDYSQDLSPLRKVYIIPFRHFIRTSPVFDVRALIKAVLWEL